MAEEKKSPNLKDRLKRTQVGQAPAPGGPIAPPVAAGGGPIMPPVSAPAPAGADGFNPPANYSPQQGGGIPGIPGLGGDVAPPAFVQQQQKADAAAARARAAAADPFASSSVSAAAVPQQLVIQMDNKDVADHEVGRTRSGTIVAIVITGVIALGAGYAIGNLVETKNQERQTLQALTGVRTEIVRLGDVINGIKQHVDHAVEAGNIVVTRGEGEEGAAAAPPTHPPDVDEPLLEWFRSQPGDVPFSPDVYAGRVGRLRSQVVSKLTLVTLQFTQAWTLLQQHVQRTNVANIRTALQSANPANNEMAHMLVTFGRASADAAPFAMLVSAAGPPTATGAVPISGAGIPAGATRNSYAGGDIVAATLTNLAFPVAPGQGLAAQALAAGVLPWRQYQQRISELKSLVDQLAQNHAQLLDALQGHGS